MSVTKFDGVDEPRNASTKSADVSSSRRTARVEVVGDVITYEGRFRVTHVSCERNKPYINDERIKMIFFTHCIYIYIYICII